MCMRVCACVSAMLVCVCVCVCVSSVSAWLVSVPAMPAVPGAPLCLVCLYISFPANKAQLRKGSSLIIERSLTLDNLSQTPNVYMCVCIYFVYICYLLLILFAVSEQTHGLV